MKKAFTLFEMDKEDAKNFTLVQMLPDDKSMFKIFLTSFIQFTF